VDSFKPRGVDNVIEDQGRVTSWDMENDAFAALAELQKDKRIDPERIGVMGMSKGGLVAQNSAFTIRRRARQTGMLAFAAHVAIVPDCGAQFRNVETTGRPIFYMLAELDDYASPPKRCIEYSERIKAAGNPNVEVKVYKGARHGWETLGPVSYMEKAENYSKCFAIIEDDGDRTFSATGQRVAAQEVLRWMKKNCVVHGAHSGGGTEKLKRNATDDLIAFLNRNGL
jgi:dienelactone hydrolase